MLPCFFLEYLQQMVGIGLYEMSIPIYVDMFVGIIVNRVLGSFSWRKCQISFIKNVFAFEKVFNKSYFFKTISCLYCAKCMLLYQQKNLEGTNLISSKLKELLSNISVTSLMKCSNFTPFDFKNAIVFISLVDQPSSNAFFIIIYNRGQNIIKSPKILTNPFFSLQC